MFSVLPATVNEFPCTTKHRLFAYGMGASLIQTPGWWTTVREACSKRHHLHGMARIASAPAVQRSHAHSKHFERHSSRLRISVGSSSSLPKYECRISSPSLMSRRALKHHFLFIAMYTAFGKQLWFRRLKVVKHRPPAKMFISMHRIARCNSTRSRPLHSASRSMQSAATRPATATMGWPQSRSGQCSCSIFFLVTAVVLAKPRALRTMAGEANIFTSASWPG
mmetsp:Transcript_111527/g.355970  ORF Transcript_111527/g.355970 Transcript_111527/m.355970 type:complete len:223 (-) Transcript_111527:1290-1958(-)